MLGRDNKCIQILMVNLKQRGHLDLKQGMRTQTGFTWLRIGYRGSSCDDGNDSSGSIKCREFD
jgi:hypothetical protein